MHPIVHSSTIFTIAKTWKQAKYPWAEKQIKKMWYIYEREYYSAIKKEQNNVTGGNMDGSRDYPPK